MSRVIKFRAWEPQNSRMIIDPYRFEPTAEYVMQNHEAPDWEKMPYQCYEDWQDVEDGINRPCYIMQFTGLPDKNGKETFEEDLVRDEHTVFRIVWRKGRFDFERVSGAYQHPYFGDNCSRMEVIGNIYENPELLKS